LSSETEIKIDSWNWRDAPRDAVRSWPSVSFAKEHSSPSCREPVHSQIIFGVKKEQRNHRVFLSKSSLFR